MFKRRCVGVFLRPNLSQDLLFECLEVLRGYGLKVLCGGIDFDKKNQKDLEKLAQECDFLISLGGDGTLISTLHHLNSLPILGINAGRLGFLTGIKLSELPLFLSDIQRGEFVIQEYQMLSVYQDNQWLCNVINEALISKSTLPTMVQIVAKIEEKVFNYYRCDGLIVSTPLGSTAYNISAGGSIVHPSCKSILLTPLAPHSLTQRPMIVSDCTILDFEVLQDCEVIIDGQKIFSFNPNQKLRICYSQEKMRLIYPSNRDYFGVLKEKFHWGIE